MTPATCVLVGVWVCLGAFVLLFLAGADRVSDHEGEL